MAEKMTPEGLVVGLIDEPKKPKGKTKGKEKPDVENQQSNETDEQTEK